ncbi:hypothetical protein CBR_g34813 [Chara braunii]|uniref:Neurochondrin n=1 Tax=Chara braunii TaxID=69332 RepID=A0A388LJI9_CHABU|nr:hypothetical protein CBR_g34813 [Chara braunii]|eukprot:GBG82437.1 hypothetical protein CBR_g34813 [Chara braunii]
MRRGFLNAARPAKSGVGVRDAAPASSRRKSSPPPLEDPDECAGQDGLASGDTCAAAVHMDVITDIDGINGDQQRMEVDLTSSVRGCCSSASSAPGLSNAPSPGAAVVMPQMEESGGASTSASLPNRIEESMMHAETAEDNLRKPAGSLHECLALLRGSSDEQRLVGLLLATKFVSGPDESAIRAIFDAVGFEFINRLCKSGTGRRMEGRVGAEKKQDEEESLKQQEAFRHLALTLISAFCRLPDVASSVHIIRKVPMFLDIIRSREGEGPVGDSYECLVAVAGASEDGLRAVQQSDALGLIATDLSAFGFEFGWTPLSIKLMAMLVSAAGEDMFHTHSAALAAAIPSFARSFFRRQDELKFEILQILGVLLASYASRAVRQRIAINDCSRPTSSMEPEWAKNVRSGLAEILNSRVAISHRRLAIQVVRGMVELMGEEWMLGLVESMNSDDRSPPGERFFLLVVATISVEISMLLDEVAKEMSDPSASIEEQQAFMHKCFILADCYVLLERVIEVMSRTSAERDNVEDEDDMVADEQGGNKE